MAIGNKLSQQLISIIPSAVAYGISGFLGMVYLTDWKVVVKAIPFYRKAFINDTDAKNDESKDDKVDDKKTINNEEI